MLRCRGTPALWLVVTLSLALAGSTGGCGTSAVDDDGGENELTVFAAASLRDLLDDLSTLWTAEGGEPLAVSLAGSNVLGRQLLARPVADVFLSADPQWVDELEEAGRLAPTTRRPWLSNRLVVVARRDSELARAGRLDDPRRLADLSYRHLVLADPRGVPAGRYARSWLESIPVEPLDGASRSLWDAVADRVVPAGDVRAALALVEADPESLGVVYRTDAQSSARVEVLWEVRAGEGPAIEYAAAVLSDARRPERAEALLDFLSGDGGAASARAVRQTIERHGFSRIAPTDGAP